MWIKDFWNKFDIKPIKFKNKVQFKTTEFKVNQTDKFKAFKLIDDVIENAKKYYFNDIKKRKL